ncbi:MAG: DUF222 domain-containing protein, partial [Acidimicrobiia bacterium]|nr:DUF222 domain-containing protein [Acidimicrobiia bacterium]
MGDESNKHRPDGERRSAEGAGEGSGGSSAESRGGGNARGRAVGVAFDGVTPVFDGPPEQARIAELTEQLRVVSAEVSARQAKMVELTAELAALERYLPEVTLRHWLAMSVGLTKSEASRCARLATRLEELPKLTAAFAEGRLSEGIVDLCASVATP